MPFFSPVQLRVLKTSWIPALLSWFNVLLFSFIMLRNIGNNDGLRLLSASIGIFFIVAWEAVIKKDWKQLGILSGVTSIAFTLQVVLNGFFSSGDQQTGDFLISLNSFAAVLIILITRFYLNGMGDKLWAALLAALIFFIMPQSGNPLGTLSFGTDISLGTQYMIVHGIALPAIYCLIVSYNVIISLADNSFRLPVYFAKLQSRVQRTGRWEYFFLFLTACFIYLGSTGELKQLVSSFFGNTTLPTVVATYTVFRMLLMVLFIYSCAGLIRNVVTGRMLTTGSYSQWTLIMHYIPVVNIVGMALLFFAKDKELSREERAVIYLETGRTQGQNAIIATGMIAAVYNLYTLLTEPTGFRLPLISLLGILLLLKIFAYARLRAGRTYLYLVMGLNIFSILFATNEYLLISLSFLYLYYYLLVELFHPKLEIEDNIPFTEQEQYDIFKHTHNSF